VQKLRKKRKEVDKKEIRKEKEGRVCRRGEKEGEKGRREVRRYGGEKKEVKEEKSRKE
jgi:hypothetical protein